MYIEKKELSNSLLFQIQMSEHYSLLCGGEPHDNLFLILSQLPSTSSYYLGCVHASNWFTHLQRTWQTDDQNDSSVLTVCIH